MISIINNRRILGRPIGYSENHHIISKSFGGTNDKTNLIRLSGREHFIVHRLLAKIYPNSGMVHAIFKMACTGNYKHTAKTYEILRIAHAKRISENIVGNNKKSKALKGRQQTEEHIRSRTESRKNSKNSWHSNETKQKIGKANKGKPSPWLGKTIPSDIIIRRNLTRHTNGNYSWSEERKK